MGLWSGLLQDFNSSLQVLRKDGLGNPSASLCVLRSSSGTQNHYDDGLRTVSEPGCLVFQAGQRESGYGLRQITFRLDKAPGESQGNEKTIGLDIPWFEDYLS